MKLIAQLKLQLSPEQHALLKHTLEAANPACNTVSDQVWETKTFGQFALHKLCYSELHQQTGLGADVVVRGFAKVADAYKLDKKTQCRFKSLAAFPFTDRLVSHKLKPKSSVSGRLVDGRKCPSSAPHQLALLRGLRGECDLVYRKGAFYLFQTCDVDEAPELDPEGFLSVDMGSANIAVDGEGTFHQGRGLKQVRIRHRHLRSKLQACQTDSARR